MDFNTKDLTQVIFTNTTAVDFTAEMGAMYGGRPFPLRSGEQMTTNLTVAEHLGKHLARQVIMNKFPIIGDDRKQNDNRSLWNEDDLTAVANSFIKRIGEIEKPKVLTKDEILLQNTQIINESEIIDEPVSETGYKDKKEVVEELTKRGISFDARANKATLEKLLVD